MTRDEYRAIVASLDTVSERLRILEHAIAQMRSPGASGPDVEVIDLPNILQGVGAAEGGPVTAELRRKHMVPWDDDPKVTEAQVTEVPKTGSPSVRHYRLNT